MKNGGLAMKKDHGEYYYGGGDDHGDDGGCDSTFVKYICVSIGTYFCVS